MRRRKMSKRKSLILGFGFGFLKILLNEMRAITELPASVPVPSSLVVVMTCTDVAVVLDSALDCFATY